MGEREQGHNQAEGKGSRWWVGHRHHWKSETRCGQCSFARASIVAVEEEAVRERVKC